MGRSRAWLFAATIVATCTAGETGAPVQLPAVKVSANVPLVKVAEYHMLEARFGPAAVAQGHYLYIIGGLQRLNFASKTVERFDVDTGKSEIIARLHLPRFWHSAALVQDKIYVLGGAVAEGMNPLSDPDISGAMDPKTAGEVRHAGGSNGIHAPLNTGAVEILDLKTGKVSFGDPLPQPMRSFGCVAIGTQIAVMGGSLGGDLTTREAIFTDQMAVYDVDTKKWMRGFALPRATSNCAAIINGPSILVTGGYDGTTQRTVWALDRRTGKWDTLKPLCRDTSAHSMVLLDNRLFLFGDYSRPEELLAYDLKTQKSETFTLGYTPARHTAAVVANRKIYVIGGSSNKGGASLDLIQVFALSKEAKKAE